MKEKLSYQEARELLLEKVCPVKMEQIPLEESIGRVLAEELRAGENVPPFDRSPYDGYALRSADTDDACLERPAVLSILEEIPAGAVPTKAVTAGTAVKILTGAPIPLGADAVVMYEQTEFTNDTVKVSSPIKRGMNIVRAGEDVVRGQLLAPCGTKIDAGLAGALASQGIARPRVFRRPRIVVISTGNEVVEVEMPRSAGKIYNANRYTLQAVLAQTGCDVDYLGLAGDRTADIAALINRGLTRCDAVLLTGGVSAGDYDLTPAAMEQAGVELLARGVMLKPGMACAYGVKDGKLVCGLSGNPTAALANLCMIVLPALKTLCGRADVRPTPISVTLAQAFPKSSKATRVLYGILSLESGRVCMNLQKEQGNTILSALIGCDVMAIVPDGSGALEAGTTLEGYRL